MMMNDLWYEVVNTNIELIQGDIILDCPVVRWASKSIEPVAVERLEILKSAIEVVLANVVVITQACDLEQHKVENAILCPHMSLDKYKEEWESTMRAMSQNPTSKAWQRTCEDIKNGYIWNLSMLNEGNIADFVLTMNGQEVGTQGQGNNSNANH